MGRLVGGSVPTIHMLSFAYYVAAASYGKGRVKDLEDYFKVLYCWITIGVFNLCKVSMWMWRSYPMETLRIDLLSLKHFQL